MNRIPRALVLGMTLLSVLFSCKPQEDNTIPVSSISVNPTSLTLEEGETSNITATVNPSNATDKTVTWSSSSTAVATVKDGVVTAVKEGSATITAKAGGKTATCAVTVKGKFVAVTSVTLDKTSLEMTEGEEITLAATIKPENATEKDVTWTSDKTDVATVKDGKVTAVKEGTATITAKAGDQTATCKVTVKKGFVEVTSITLDKTSLSLGVGGEETLTATVKPDNATDKTVTWTSSSESIATVKDGKVKAIKNGTATITAKAGDKTAKCIVVVSKSSVAVTSITLDKTSLSLTVGEEETLTATVKPDNATDKTVTWTSSNSAVATVDNGRVKGIKEGTATITAKAGSKTAKCNVTVKAEAVPVINLESTSATLTGAVSINYGTVSFSIENVTGDVIPEVTSSDDSWLVVESISTSTVTFWADMNTDGSMRTGTLTFKYKNAEPKKFTVKQYPASYCQLIINETSREVPRDAATYKIDYSLTHSLDGYGFRFRTEHDVNWLTADYKDGIVTFTVTENTASDSRTCRLQVHYEAAQSPVWITITQLGKSGIAGPIIETSIGENDYVVLEPTGEENYLFICYVKNPIPGVDLVAKADVDWIKNIKKYNDYYYSFDALPNNTEDTREGHIDLTYSTVHKRLTFIQVPND